MEGREQGHPEGPERHAEQCIGRRRQACRASVRRRPLVLRFVGANRAASLSSAEPGRGRIGMLLVLLALLPTPAASAPTNPQDRPGERDPT